MKDLKRTKYRVLPKERTYFVGLLPGLSITDGRNSLYMIDDKGVVAHCGSASIFYDVNYQLGDVADLLDYITAYPDRVSQAPVIADDSPELSPAQPEEYSIKPASKYHREIKKGVFVDVYDVLRAFKVQNPALQHLIKKALAAGERGHKDTETDLQDIIDSAVRAKELHLEQEKIDD